MPNQKISELSAIETIDNALDVLPIVDTSTNTTKKVTPTQIKAALSLNNVDNTSDLNKPISTATQTALDGKQASLGFTAENAANKSTSVVTDQASNVKYPTVKALYDWAVATFQAALGYTPANRAGDTFTGAISATNLSGTNTGDNAVNSLYSGLATSKQDTLVSGTNIKTVNSTSLLGSGDIAVQATLVSGTNIKTINSTSLLGSGDITISASPSGVAGAIQFSNGSAFASDAANLFWDDTNNRLGIGTNAPTANVHIIGANQLANTFNTKIEGASGFGIFSIANDGAAQIGDYTGNGFQSSLYFLRPSGASRASRLIQGNADLTLTNAVGGFVMNGLQCTIKGSGSTPATTSLLVQNSAGSNAFQIKDDRTIDTFANTIGNQTWGQTIVGLGASGEMRLQSGGGAGFFMTFHTSGSEAMRIDSQRNVGINTLASNNTSAILQIDSTTKGVLFPRMTTTQKNAIATPASGLVVYDTTTNKLCCYNGSTWNDLF